jgi:hypothetical protein
MVGSRTLFLIKSITENPYICKKEINMKKRFNIAGTCHPDFHYMMNNSKKLEEVMQLIEYGDYFTINRPRQFGKTTMLFLINKALEKRENYLSIQLNFQGIDSQFLQSDITFGQMFLMETIQSLKKTNKELAATLANLDTPTTLNDISTRISELIEMTDKKVVLLIDEVDSSSNYSSFLVFLGMLRTKFLKREYGDYTFHSVILAGVHDIKNLKFKLRNPEAAQYNSPWNIAVDFEVRMSFNAEEIAPMLEQYSEAENIKMDIPAIAERLYYHTSGYPFLVSKICKNIDGKILPKKENKTEWTLDDVEASVQLLLLENNTNFDDLIKNLKNHQDLYDLVFRIVIEGETISFNPDNETISKGILYGIFKRNGSIKIHNRVYEQRIYNYVISNMEVQLKTENYNDNNQFKLPNNELNLEKVIEKFQEFFKQEYSEKDQKFLEREWRIIFLAFLRPILNGSGYTFKEVQVSEEKRLDVTITYFQHQYIVELKRWYGEAAHERGIEQLSDYLERQNKKIGYLIIFEYLRGIGKNKTKKTWRIEKIDYNGKEIFAVWV